MRYSPARFVMVGAAIALLSSLASAQETLDRCWFVVLATYSTDYTVMKQHTDEMEAKLKPCGFRPFNDFSSKFSGFRPDLVVFVLGAFRTAAAADHVRAAVRSCVPDAYVKAGKYAGE